MSIIIKSRPSVITLMVVGFLLAGSVAVFGAAPLNVSLSPASGTIEIGKKVTVSTVYSDPDGVSNLWGCYALLNTTINGANAIYLCYSENLNKLYLRNDANTAWLGGTAPGSNIVMQNSRCKVYCSETTAVKSGNQVKVNWKIEFKSIMSGKTWPVYMMVEDDTKIRDGWDKMGTLVFGRAPINTSITPANSTVASKEKLIATTKFSDPDGYRNLRGVYLVANTVFTGANGVYFCYSENLNKLYLRNDANTAWLGGYAPGTAQVIENSQCKLYCAETTVKGSGNDLTVDWIFELKPKMDGKLLKAWLTCFDDTDLREDYDQMGSFVVKAAPTGVSITPSTASVAEGATTTFTCKFMDLNGAGNLKECWFAIDKYDNTTRTETNAGTFVYEPLTNKLYRSEDFQKKIGGFTPGSAGILESKYCRVYCADTTVSKSGNYVTVNWKVDFKPRTVANTYDLYLAAIDNDNLLGSWIDLGDVTVNQTTMPVNETFKPFSGPLTGGVKLTFTTDTSDRDGYSNIAGSYVLFNTSINGANAAYLYYDANTNKLYLRNDTGTAWLGGLAPGTANVIENRNCKLYCADTTVQKSGDKLTVNWKVEFKLAFAGKTCRAYVLAIDKNGKRDGWDQMGFFSGSGVLGDTITTETGLQYRDIEIGTGPAPAIGDKISVHYTGRLTNGTQFDSSIGGSPFQFEVGMGGVIVGWDEALPSMRIGGKRILTIPPELGYGSQARTGIPANSTLIFDTQLMGIVAPAQ